MVATSRESCSYGDHNFGLSGVPVDLLEFIQFEPEKNTEVFIIIIDMQYVLCGYGLNQTQTGSSLQSLRKANAPFSHLRQNSYENSHKMSYT